MSDNPVQTIALALVVVGAAVGVVGGCSSPAGPMRGVERAERSLGESQPVAVESAVVASIGGHGVTREQLWGPLAEGYGGLALEELVLDRELDRLARLRGVTIGESDLQGERMLLAQTLARGELSDEDAGAILVGLRDERGLGPRRFGALLKRNAMLRALVDAQVQPSEAEIRRAFDIVFGERIQARLIVVATDREAAKLRGEIGKGEGGLATRFAQSARRASIDPSGEFGGALDPLSPIDPAYPRVLRSALDRTEPGQMTAVLALDGAYAIALVEARIAPEATTLDAERGRLVRVMRQRNERSAMAKLSERLVREAKVEVIDRSLAWSWDRRGR